MVRGSRRQSQNSNLMRRILEHLREYDLDEIELLCKKYLDKEKSSSDKSSTRNNATDLK